MGTEAFMQRWRAERLYKNVFNARFSCESFSMWLMFALLFFDNLLFRLRLNFFVPTLLKTKFAGITSWLPQFHCMFPCFSVALRALATVAKAETTLGEHDPSFQNLTFKVLLRI